MTIMNTIQPIQFGQGDDMNLRDLPALSGGIFFVYVLEFYISQIHNGSNRSSLNFSALLDFGYWLVE